MPRINHLSLSVIVCRVNYYCHYDGQLGGQLGELIAVELFSYLDIVAGLILSHIQS